PLALVKTHSTFCSVKRERLEIKMPALSNRHSLRLKTALLTPAINNRQNLLRRNHQGTHMCRGSAGQAAQTIPTLENRHNTSLASLVRYLYQFFGDPAIIVILQIKPGQRIRMVRIKSRRNNNQLWIKLFDSRQHFCLDTR